MSENIKQKAIDKLNEFLKEDSENMFRRRIVDKLIERCNEDEGLSEDVIQEHKTWNKCEKYIYDKARKLAKKNCAIVEDKTVFEWAEDYFHKDDKAEEEKKAKEAEKAAKKAEKIKKETKERVKAEMDAKTDPATEEPKEVIAGVFGEPAEVPTEKPKEKPKKASKKDDVMDGQMDLFSMMGL